jgi:hypothetical protein
MILKYICLIVKHLLLEFCFRKLVSGDTDHGYSGDDWCKLLIEEKDKRIAEKDSINQEQKRYIEYLEDKLKNVGLL